RQAHKARSAGYEVVSGAALLDEIFSLWNETRDRQGIAEWVHQDGYRELAKLDGLDGLTCHILGVRNPAAALEAGGLFLGDESRVYYLLGASVRGDSGSGAPTLLHIDGTNLIFRQRGNFIYDWVGANTPSVCQFKRKFRPSLEVLQRIEWRKGLGKLIG